MKKSHLAIGFFISGTAALIYEELWTKELALVFGSTGYALSTVLASFMAGLSIGSLAGGKIARRRDAVATFGQIQLILCGLGLIMGLVLDRLSPIFALLYYQCKGMPTLFLLCQFAIIFVILVIPTIFMGMTFPLAISGYVNTLDSVPEDSGKLYAINTIGSVVGAVLAGFVTIPLLGLNKTLYIAAFCNFLAGTIVLRGRGKKALSAAILLLATAAHAATPPRSYYFNLYNAVRTPSYDIFKRAESFFQVVWRKDDPEGTVVITKGINSDYYGLSIKGKPEGGTTNPATNPAPELMSYLLLAYRPEAKSFLKIGLGTGETTMAATRERTLDKIDVVEINHAVIEASRRFFFPQIFADSRVRFITEDARKYLYLNDVHYDLISSQATDPTDESSGFLFTSEYFRLVRNRLSSDGIFGMFLPTYLLGDEGGDIIVKTLVSVFPYCYSWRIDDIPFLIASLKPLGKSPDEITKRIEQYSPGRTKLLQFVSGPETLRKFAEASPAPLNTDDWPVVEFIAARNLMQ